MNSTKNDCSNVERFFDQLVEKMKLDFTRTGVSEGAFPNSDVPKMEEIYNLSMDIAKKTFSELLKKTDSL